MDKVLFVGRDDSIWNVRSADISSLQIPNGRGLCLDVQKTKNGSAVWVVNTNNEIWKKDIEGEKTHEWQQVKSHVQAAQVAVSADSSAVFLLGVDGLIYSYIATSDSFSETAIDAGQESASATTAAAPAVAKPIMKFVQFDVGTSETGSPVFYAVDTKGHVYKYSSQTKEWEMMRTITTVKYIAVGGGQVWINTSDNNVYKWKGEKFEYQNTLPNVVDLDVDTKGCCHILMLSGQVLVSNNETSTWALEKVFPKAATPKVDNTASTLLDENEEEDEKPVEHNAVQAEEEEEEEEPAEEEEEEVANNARDGTSPAEAEGATINYEYPALPRLHGNSSEERIRTNPLNANETSHAKSPSKSISPKKQSSISPTKSRSTHLSTNSALQSSISKAPKFYSEEELERRRQKKEERSRMDMEKTSMINMYREKQRKLIKEDYELGREQNLAEKKVYQEEKKKQWQKKMSKSPFVIDLVADTERIEETNATKKVIEEKKKKQDEKKLNTLKSSLIVNALLDVPNATDAHRLYKRQYTEDMRRMKALEDIKKAEVIQDKQQKKAKLLHSERLRKVELKALQEML